MNSESTYFLTAGFASAMIAVQMTLFWSRHRSSKGIEYWTLAAWSFALADLLFVVSSAASAPGWRLVSRTMVTATYGMLLLGAQCAADRKPRVGLVLAGVLLYAVSLPILGSFPDSAPWRVVFSRVIWGGFCLTGYLTLRSTSNHYGKSLISPAGIFLLQAIYLFCRALVYVILAIDARSGEPAFLVYVDYANSMMFAVALFFALLVALIEERNTDLAAFRVELKTLSGLLPICAWCKKVRDDAGYWHELTEHLTTHNFGKITHGICQSCAERMSEENNRPPTV